MGEQAKDVIMALLKQRGSDKSICPSEAARELAGSGGNWRAQMENVHLAVDALLAEGRIALSWKGQELGERRGAYRIAHRSPEP